MTPLTAKDNYFKTHTEKERSDLLELLNSTPVRTAMIYATAQMASLGYSKEELNGAGAFVNFLISMAEPKTPPSEFKPVQLERVPNTPDGR